MLTDAELAAMRETAEAALPDAAVVHRSTWASDGGGGGSVAWSASGTFDARFGPTSGTETIVAGGQVAQVDGFVTLPHDVDVTARDRVVVASTTYEIVTVLAHETWRLMKRLAVRRVR